MALLLDGKKVQIEMVQSLRRKIGALSSPPTLAILQIGNRAESDAYIERKKKFGEKIGARIRHIRMSTDASEAEILSAIKKLNSDSAVHGIILQLPIPETLNRERLLDAIALEKDVDGLGSEQARRRAESSPEAVVPATARGVMELLEHYHIPVRGKRAAVLGRSALVGAPTAEALRRAGAEVTVCHSETLNTKEVTRASDIVVVAIGKPRFVGREYFRNDKTQTVVDVGITSVEGMKLQEEVGLHRPEGSVGRTTGETLSRGVLGDVDFEAVNEMVAAISPVPGGVGPMTVAALFENLVFAYEIQHP